MKHIPFIFLLLLPLIGKTEVYRCEEPHGANMWSTENQRVALDKSTGVKPVVTLEEKELKVVWGDSKNAGGTERVWTGLIFHRGLESVSAIALDEGANASAAMLFTFDTKRGYLYFSQHKSFESLNASSAVTQVSKCSM